MSGYTFDRRATVGKFEIMIDSKAQYGYFEHEELGDEMGGGLWFADGELVDYDGVAVLPKAVITALRDMGFVVSEDFE